MTRSRVFLTAAFAAVALLVAFIASAPARQHMLDVGWPTSPATPPDPAPRLMHPAAPAPAPTASAPQAQLKEKGIDDLVAELESIKARKADLEKAEKEAVALLKEKLKQQRERLEKLGVTEEPKPPVAIPAPASAN